jgi:hypothetical protein
VVPEYAALPVPRSFGRLTGRPRSLADSCSRSATERSSSDPGGDCSGDGGEASTERRRVPLRRNRSTGPASSRVNACSVFARSSARRATRRCESRHRSGCEAPSEGLGFRPVSTAVPRGSARVCDGWRRETHRAPFRSSDQAQSDEASEDRGRALSPGRSTRRSSLRVGAGAQRGLRGRERDRGSTRVGPVPPLFRFDKGPGTGRCRRDASRQVRATNERSRPASSTPSPRPDREADRRGRGRSVPGRAAGCRPSARRP